MGYSSQLNIIKESRSSAFKEAGTITLAKTKTDENPAWNTYTFQIDLDKDEVKRFVKWWNRSKTIQKYIPDSKNSRHSWAYELENIGRSKVKVEWVDYNKDGGTVEGIQQILQTALDDFMKEPKPEPKVKRRTPEEREAEAKAIPPMDPLLLETLQKEVDPYLEVWGKEIVETYTKAWQEYVDWTEQRGEIAGGEKSPITGRYYAHSGKPWVMDYLQEEVFKKELVSYRGVSHTLGRWAGYGFKTVDEMKHVFVKMAEDFKEYARVHFLQRVAKHLPLQEDSQVTEVKTSYVEENAGTIEGQWVITYSDGVQKSLNTKIIWAGGYNIQRLHTRYLVKVRDLT